MALYKGVSVRLGAGSSGLDESSSMVTRGSLMRALISETNSAAFWPGSRRQSSVASASDGMTFAFGGSPTPLRREVTESVFCWTAFMNLFGANSPSSLRRLATRGFGFWEGGKFLAFSIACISMSFALSGMGCDPCPDVP